MALYYCYNCDEFFLEEEIESESIHEGEGSHDYYDYYDVCPNCHEEVDEVKIIDLVEAYSRKVNLETFKEDCVNNLSPKEREDTQFIEEIKKMGRDELKELLNDQLTDDDDLLDSWLEYYNNSLTSK